MIHVPRFQSIILHCVSVKGQVIKIKNKEDEEDHQIHNQDETDTKCVYEA